MNPNRERAWGIVLCVVLALLMLEAYIYMNLHKMLSMFFIIVYIVHVALSRKRIKNSNNRAFYIVLIAIVLTGILNIVFKVRLNTTGQAISLVLHELSAWAMVALSILHSTRRLKILQRR